MTMTTWQVQEAKARLSEVRKKAVTDGSQSITVRGGTAVVLSQEEFERLQGAQPGFVELMRSSPLVGERLDLRREDSPTREVVAHPWLVCLGRVRMSPQHFVGRLLGRLLGEVGRPVPAIDSMIAATALHPSLAGEPQRGRFRFSGA